VDCQPGLTLDPAIDVEVLFDGKWVASRAIQTRRCASGQQTLVSWTNPDEGPHRVHEAWVYNSHVRAVHLAD
jgi:hypothetical protein